MKMSLKELLKEHRRLIILYPVYLGKSQILEEKYPFLKEIRENPKKYRFGYISNKCNIPKDTDEPLVEIMTELNDKHVEVIVKIYRKPPPTWETERVKFLGYEFANLVDCDINISYKSIHCLKEIH